jgi:hypothetical protein
VAGGQRASRPGRSAEASCHRWVAAYERYVGELPLHHYDAGSLLIKRFTMCGEMVGPQGVEWRERSAYGYQKPEVSDGRPSGSIEKDRGMASRFYCETQGIWHQLSWDGKGAVVHGTPTQKS